MGVTLKSDWWALRNNKGGILGNAWPSQSSQTLGAGGFADLRKAGARPLWVTGNGVPVNVPVVWESASWANKCQGTYKYDICYVLCTTCFMYSDYKSTWMIVIYRNSSNREQFPSNTMMPVIAHTSAFSVLGIWALIRWYYTLVQNQLVEYGTSTVCHTSTSNTELQYRVQVQVPGMHSAYTYTHLYLTSLLSKDIQWRTS